MKAVLPVLRRVRENLTDPMRWTQNAMARMPSGRASSIMSPGVSQWCLVGAIEHELMVGCYGWNGHVIVEVGDELCRTLNIPPLDNMGAISAWNDSVNHEDVLKALDTTIERLEHARKS